MKRFYFLMCLCIASIGISKAQVEPQYGPGSIRVINGRVLFEDTIRTSLPIDQAFKRTESWAKKRFSKPNVIISKFICDDINDHKVSFTAEEYIVFTNRFFVLDRTRINYWAEIQCHEGYTVFKMTRINYWYEEEREGGSKFSAEETITDENAFNRKKTKLLKEQGKFRRGTIDFFNRCVKELSENLIY